MKVPPTLHMMHIKEKEKGNCSSACCSITISSLHHMWLWVSSFSRPTSSRTNGLYEFYSTENNFKVVEKKKFLSDFFFNLSLNIGNKDKI